MRACVLCLIAIATIALSGCGPTSRDGVETSVIRVLAIRSGASGAVVSRGTAFKVGAPAVVVTNYHVIEGATSIFLVFLRDGKVMETEASVAYGDRSRDLALLRGVQPLPGGPLPIAGYVPPSGAEAWAYGFPGAADVLFGQVRTLGDFLEKLASDPSMSVPTRTSGTISGERQRDRVTYIQHQVPITHGSSGGPLVDSCGVVIGLNTLGVTGTSAINGAVSSREVVELMRLGSVQANVVASRCWILGEPRYLPYSVAAGVVLLVLLSGIAWLFHALASSRGGIAPSARSPSAVGHGTQPEGRVVAITPIEIPPSGAAVARPAMAPPFDAPAAVHDTAVARLIPVRGGKPVPVPMPRGTGTIVIGRQQGCDLVLDDPMISRRHCELVVGAGGELRIVDSSSGNGTWINGNRITNSPLRSGDKLRLGTDEHVFELVDGAGPLNAPIEELPAAPPAWVLSIIDDGGGTERFTLEPATGERTWLLGRMARSCDIVVASSTVSAQHAAIRARSGGMLEIQDRRSSNGTMVDGRRLAGEWTKIDETSTIRLGACELRLTRRRG